MNNQLRNKIFSKTDVKDASTDIKIIKQQIN